MVIRQKFNKRTNAFVKIKFVKGKRAKIMDVKQNNPKKPFKGIKIIK